MKRETSVSVSDLQDLNTINDSVKRLALNQGQNPFTSSAPASPSSNRGTTPNLPDTPLQSPVFLSPNNTPERSGSASSSPLSSSGASYVTSEILHPKPLFPLSIQIPPLLHPSQLSIPSSMAHVNGGSSSTAGRTFSQGGTVLDTICDRNAFYGKYEIGPEIGRGGFSTVYSCRQRQNQAQYAVKIVDLRPLRLREKFNPSRLRREVDIMKRLRHPNIVEFIEGFETEEQLLMVMELCPGEELFDVILARQRFSERDAKPVFAQVTGALYYLHCLNIIHRDVKPENILILNRKDNHGNIIAKLLDFGLSKNAGAGSAAKTFVGTPCYLSPEVEYTSKGLGGTYGLPADCWSLGAVLYVMLVARFPEFEQNPQTGKIVLKLPPQLWGDISQEAKHLVSSLMNTNPNARLTTREALLHPWLGAYRSSPHELDTIAVSSYDLGQNLQEEAEAEATRMEQEGIAGEEYDELTAGGNAVHRHAMVLRTNQYNITSNGGVSPMGVDQLQLAPLLRLQRSIATCFAEAHASYQDFPEVATQVRRGAVLCRQQFNESTKMLSKVEQTAQSVLHLFPDLILAVEEGEPELAADFFKMVREWVVELRDMVANTQKVNQASMAQIQTIVERSTLRLQDRASRRERKVSPRSLTLPKKIYDIVKQLNITRGGSNSSEGDAIGWGVAQKGGEAETLTTEQVLELFMGLFGQSQPSSQTASSHNSSNSLGALGQGDSSAARNAFMNGTPSANSSVIGGSIDDESCFDDSGMLEVEDVDGLSSDSIAIDDLLGMDMQESLGQGDGKSEHLMSSVPNLMIPEPDADADAGVVATTNSSSPVAATRLADALHKLRQVDMILEQLSVFWANTEVVLDMLTKKGQHVEQLIGFSQKPRLMARFRERMEEYKRFWEGVSTLCKNYVSGASQAVAPEKGYSFLDGDDAGMFQDLIRSSSSANLQGPGGISLPVTGARVDKIDSL